MLPRREVGLVCLGFSFVVSALPTGSLAKLEKKAGYREAERSWSNPMLVVRDQPAPATANKSTSHLKIVIISIAALIVLCAIVFSLYRWRMVFARLFSKQQKEQPSTVITSPLGGFSPVDHRGIGTPSPMSESRHSDVLFGGYDMPARPVPAQKRAPQPTTLGTFFLADDDELAPLPSGPRAKVPSRKTKRRSLKLAIEPSPPNGSAEPDSPAAAKEMMRFSWGTAPSEKPRFRTVDSWVGNQAERWNPAGAGENTEAGGKTPVTLEPSTPAVCRQHPGVPVELTGPERVNSVYLDRRLGERY